MKKSDTSKDSALTNLHKLNEIMLEKNLVEKSVSMQTTDRILSPIQYLEWEGKAKYADQLITILETSKTEQEILDRASKIQV